MEEGCKESCPKGFANQGTKMILHGNISWLGQNLKEIDGFFARNKYTNVLMY